MDADDTLPAHTGESILRGALAAPPAVAGLVVPVQFVDEGPGAGTRVDHVKLFRNIPGLRFEGHIHEQILGSVKAHGEIARIDAVVLHSGYDSTVEGQKKKRKRDFKLLDLDFKERPKHPFVLFNLGMTCHYTRDHKKAIDWLTKSIEHSQEGESHLRKAYALLAGSQRHVGRKREAEETLRAGLKAVGEDPELHFQLGVLLGDAGRFAEAREQYLAVPTSADGYYSSVDVGILGFKRYHNLGIVCAKLGLYKEAKEWWTLAMRESPAFTLSAFSLFEEALTQEDLAGARMCLDHVLEVEGPRANWTRMAQKYAEATGGPENVEPFLLRAAQQHPWSMDIRMAIARGLLAGERVREAMPILADLQDRGVAEAAFYLGVAHIRAGRYEVALRWMERALALSPGHEETQRQVENLRRALKQE